MDFTKKLYCFIRIHIKIEKGADFSNKNTLCTEKILGPLDRKGRAKYNEQRSELARMLLCSTEWGKGGAEQSMKKESGRADALRGFFDS